MKIKFLYVFFLIFLSCAASHAQNANVATNSYFQNKQVVETPKTMIFGRVIYADSGKPVRRGTISLLKIPPKTADDSKQAYESLEDVYNSKTVTNEDGEFRMENIPAGEYYPLINVVGVLNPNVYNEFFRDESKVSTSKLDAFFEKITIIEGVQEQPVLIRARRGGAISGRVLYADGEPAVNMKVEILRRGNYVFEGSSRSSALVQMPTDDRGFYRFPGLPPGEYTVRITEPANTVKIDYYGSSGSELKTYYGDTAKAAEAKTIELELGEEKSEINITIPDRKTFKLSGIVVSKNGRKLIQNARIDFTRKGDSQILSYDLSTRYSSSFTSNVKGEWSITDLPEGTYIFSVSPPAEYNYESNEAVRKKKEPQFAETKKEIVIENKNLENIVFEMPFEAKVSGTVVFEDKREIKDLYIYLYDEESETIKTTSFNEDTYEQERKNKTAQWNFTVTGLSEGNYFINITSFGADDGFYVKSIKSGSGDLESSPLQLKEGDDIKDIQVVLATDYGTLKGKIESSDAKLLKAMQVILISADKPNARNLIKNAPIDENGEFQVKVAPGEYFVIAETIEFFRVNLALKHDEWIQKIIPLAEKVKIKPKETQTITIKKNP